MPKPNQDLPDEKKRGILPDNLPEGEYAPPGESISPGAHPEGIKPSEDPRKDAGLEPEAEPKT